MDQEENGTDVPVILQLSGMSVPCFMRSLFSRSLLHVPGLPLPGHKRRQIPGPLSGIPDGMQCRQGFPGHPGRSVLRL